MDNKNKIQFNQKPALIHPHSATETSINIPIVGNTSFITTTSSKSVAILINILFLLFIIALPIAWYFFCKRRRTMMISWTPSTFGAANPTATPPFPNQPAPLEGGAASYLIPRPPPLPPTTPPPRPSRASSAASPLSIVPASPLFCKRCGRRFFLAVGDPETCLICRRTPVSPAPAQDGGFFSGVFREVLG